MALKTARVNTRLQEVRAEMTMRERKRQEDVRRRQEKVHENQQEVLDHNLLLLKRWRQRDRMRTKLMQDRDTHRRLHAEMLCMAKWEERKRSQREKLTQVESVLKQEELERQENIAKREQYVYRQRKRLEKKLERLKRHMKEEKIKKDELYYKRFRKNLASGDYKLWRKRKDKRRSRAKTFSSTWKLEDILLNLTDTTAQGERPSIMTMINEAMNDLDDPPENQDLDELHAQAKQIVQDVFSKVTNEIYPQYLKTLEDERESPVKSRSVRFSSENDQIDIDFAKMRLPDNSASDEDSVCLRPVSEHILTPCASQLEIQKLEAAAILGSPELEDKTSSVTFVETLLLRLLDDLNMGKLSKDDLMKLASYSMDIIQSTEASAQANGIILETSEESFEAAESSSSIIAKKMVDFTLSKILNDIQAGNVHPDDLASLTVSLLDDAASSESSASISISDQDLEAYIEETLRAATSTALDPREDSPVCEALLDDFMVNTLKKLIIDLENENLSKSQVETLAISVRDETKYILQTDSDEDLLDSKVLQQILHDILNQIQGGDINIQNLYQIVFAIVYSYNMLKAPPTPSFENKITHLMKDILLTAEQKAVCGDLDNINVNIVHEANERLSQGNLDVSQIEQISSSIISTVSQPEVMCRTTTSDIARAIVEDALTKAKQTLESEIRDGQISQAVQNVAEAVISTTANVGIGSHGGEQSLTETLFQVLTSLKSFMEKNEAVEKTDIYEIDYLITQMTQNKISFDQVEQMSYSIVRVMKSPIRSESSLSACLIVRDILNHVNQDLQQGVIENSILKEIIDNVTLSFRAAQSMDARSPTLLNALSSFLKTVMLYVTDKVQTGEFTDSDILDLSKAMKQNIGEHNSLLGLKDTVFEEIDDVQIKHEYVDQECETLDNLNVFDPNDVLDHFHKLLIEIEEGNIPTDDVNSLGKRLIECGKSLLTELSRESSDIFTPGSELLAENVVEEVIRTLQLEITSGSLTQDSVKEITKTILSTTSSNSDLASELVRNTIRGIHRDIERGYEPSKLPSIPTLDHSPSASTVASHIVMHTIEALQNDVTQHKLNDHVIASIASSIVSIINDDKDILKNIPQEFNKVKKTIGAIITCLKNDSIDQLDAEKIFCIILEKYKDFVSHKDVEFSVSVTSEDKALINDLVAETLLNIERSVKKGKMPQKEFSIPSITQSDYTSMAAEELVDQCIDAIKKDLATEKHVSRNRYRDISDFILDVVIKLKCELAGGTVSNLSMAHFFQAISDDQSDLRTLEQNADVNLTRIIEDIETNKMQSIYIQRILETYLTTEQAKDGVFIDPLKAVESILITVSSDILTKFVKATLQNLLIEIREGNGKRVERPPSVIAIQSASSMIAENVIQEVIARIKDDMTKHIHKIHGNVSKQELERAASKLLSESPEKYMKQDMDEADQKHSRSNQSISSVRSKDVEDIVFETLHNIVSSLRYEQSIQVSKQDFERAASKLFCESPEKGIKQEMNEADQKHGRSNQSISSVSSKDVEDIVFETLRNIVSSLRCEQSIHVSKQDFERAASKLFSETPEKCMKQDMKEADQKHSRSNQSISSVHSKDVEDIVLETLHNIVSSLRCEQSIHVSKQDFERAASKLFSESPEKGIKQDMKESYQKHSRSNQTISSGSSKDVEDIVFETLHKIVSSLRCEQSIHVSKHDFERAASKLFSETPEKGMKQDMKVANQMHGRSNQSISSGSSKDVEDIVFETLHNIVSSLKCEQSIHVSKQDFERAASKLFSESSDKCIKQDIKEANQKHGRSNQSISSGSSKGVDDIFFETLHNIVSSLRCEQSIHVSKHDFERAASKLFSESPENGIKQDMKEADQKHGISNQSISSGSSKGVDDIVFETLHNIVSSLRCEQSIHVSKHDFERAASKLFSETPEKGIKQDINEAYQKHGRSNQSISSVSSKDVEDIVFETLHNIVSSLRCEQSIHVSKQDFERAASKLFSDSPDKCIKQDMKEADQKHGRSNQSISSGSSKDVEDIVFETLHNIVSSLRCEQSIDVSKQDFERAASKLFSESPEKGIKQNMKVANQKHGISNLSKSSGRSKDVEDIVFETLHNTVSSLRCEQSIDVSKQDFERAASKLFSDSPDKCIKQDMKEADQKHGRSNLSKSSGRSKDVEDIVFETLHNTVSSLRCEQSIDVSKQDFERAASKLFSETPEKGIKQDMKKANQKHGRSNLSKSSGRSKDVEDTVFETLHNTVSSLRCEQSIDVSKQDFERAASKLFSETLEIGIKQDMKKANQKHGRSNLSKSSGRSKDVEDIVFETLHNIVSSLRCEQSIHVSKQDFERAASKLFSETPEKGIKQDMKEANQKHGRSNLSKSFGRSKDVEDIVFETLHNTVSSLRCEQSIHVSKHDFERAASKLFSESPKKGIKQDMKEANQKQGRSNLSKSSERSKDVEDIVFETLHNTVSSLRCEQSIHVSKQDFERATSKLFSETPEKGIKQDLKTAYQKHGRSNLSISSGSSKDVDDIVFETLHNIVSSLRCEQSIDVSKQDFERAASKLFSETPEKGIKQDMKESNQKHGRSNQSISSGSSKDVDDIVFETLHKIVSSLNREQSIHVSKHDFERAASKLFSKTPEKGIKQDMKESNQKHGRSNQSISSGSSKDVDDIVFETLHKIVSSLNREQSIHVSKLDFERAASKLFSETPEKGIKQDLKEANQKHSRSNQTISSGSSKDVDDIVFETLHNIVSSLRCEQSIHVSKQDFERATSKLFSETPEKGIKQDLKEAKQKHSRSNQTIASGSSKDVDDIVFETLHNIVSSLRCEQSIHVNKQDFERAASKLFSETPEKGVKQDMKVANQEHGRSNLSISSGSSKDVDDIVFETLHNIVSSLRCEQSIDVSKQDFERAASKLFSETPEKGIKQDMKEANQKHGRSNQSISSGSSKDVDDIVFETLHNIVSSLRCKQSIHVSKQDFERAASKLFSETPEKGIKQDLKAANQKHSRSNQTISSGSSKDVEDIVFETLHNIVSSLRCEQSIHVSKHDFERAASKLFSETPEKGVKQDMKEANQKHGRSNQSISSGSSKDVDDIVFETLHNIVSSLRCEQSIDVSKQDFERAASKLFSESSEKGIKQDMKEANQTHGISNQSISSGSSKDVEDIVFETLNNIVSSMKCEQSIHVSKQDFERAANKLFSESPEKVIKQDMKEANQKHGRSNLSISSESSKDVDDIILETLNNIVSSLRGEQSIHVSKQDFERAASKLFSETPEKCMKQDMNEAYQKHSRSNQSISSARSKDVEDIVFETLHNIVSSLRCEQSIHVSKQDFERAASKLFSESPEKCMKQDMNAADEKHSRTNQSISSVRSKDVEDIVFETLHNIVSSLNCEQSIHVSKQDFERAASKLFSETPEKYMKQDTKKANQKHSRSNQSISSARSKDVEDIVFETLNNIVSSLRCEQSIQVSKQDFERAASKLFSESPEKCMKQDMNEAYQKHSRTNQSISSVRSKDVDDIILETLHNIVSSLRCEQSIQVSKQDFERAASKLFSESPGKCMKRDMKGADQKHSRSNQSIPSVRSKDVEDIILETLHNIVSNLRFEQSMHPRKHDAVSDKESSNISSEVQDFVLHTLQNIVTDLQDRRSQMELGLPRIHSKIGSSIELNSGESKDAIAYVNEVLKGVLIELKQEFSGQNAEHGISGEIKNELDFNNQYTKFGAVIIDCLLDVTTKDDLPRNDTVTLEGDQKEEVHQILIESVLGTLKNVRAGRLSQVDIVTMHNSLAKYFGEPICTAEEILQKEVASSLERLLFILNQQDIAEIALSNVVKHIATLGMENNSHLETGTPDNAASDASITSSVISELVQDVLVRITEQIKSEQIKSEALPIQIVPSIDHRKHQSRNEVGMDVNFNRRDSASSSMTDATNYCSQPIIELENVLSIKKPIKEKEVKDVISTISKIDKRNCKRNIAKNVKYASNTTQASIINTYRPQNTPALSNISPSPGRERRDTRNKQTPGQKHSGGETNATKIPQISNMDTLKARKSTSSKPSKSIQNQMPVIRRSPILRSSTVVTVTNKSPKQQKPKSSKKKKISETRSAGKPRSPVGDPSVLKSVCGAHKTKISVRKGNL